jgi:hypothetical protein
LTDSINFSSTIFCPTINNALSQVNQTNNMLCSYPTGFLIIWEANPALVDSSHTKQVSLKNKETQQETVFVPLKLLITLPYSKTMHPG